MHTFIVNDKLFEEKEDLLKIECDSVDDVAYQFTVTNTGTLLQSMINEGDQITIIKKSICPKSHTSHSNEMAMSSEYETYKYSNNEYRNILNFPNEENENNKRFIEHSPEIEAAGDEAEKQLMIENLKESNTPFFLERQLGFEEIYRINFNNYKQVIFSVNSQNIEAEHLNTKIQSILFELVSEIMNLDDVKSIFGNPNEEKLNKLTSYLQWFNCRYILNEKKNVIKALFDDEHFIKRTINASNETSMLPDPNYIKLSDTIPITSFTIFYMPECICDIISLHGTFDINEGDKVYKLNFKSFHSNHSKTFIEQVRIMFKQCIESLFKHYSKNDTSFYNIINKCKIDTRLNEIEYYGNHNFDDANPFDVIGDFFTDIYYYYKEYNFLLNNLVIHEYKLFNDKYKYILKIPEKKAVKPGEEQQGFKNLSKLKNNKLELNVTESQSTTITLLLKKKLIGNTNSSMNEFLRRKNFPHNALKKPNYQLNDKVWYKSSLRNSPIEVGIITKVRSDSYAVDTIYLANNTKHRHTWNVYKKNNKSPNAANMLRERKETFTEIDKN